MRAPAARVALLGYACLDYRFWVERFPPAGARTPAGAYRMDLGGPAAVGALTVARLGGAAVFFGRRGDDDAGRRAEAILSAEGVDTHGFRAFAGARTPVSGVLIAPDGERHIFAYRGEGLPDAAEWLPLDALRSAQAVLLDGRWPAGAARAAEAARRQGLPVVLDLDGETAAAMRLAGLSTHVIADEEMAAACGGVDRLLSELTELGVWGAVTQGAAGVVHAAGRVPGFPVTARDTTGAGDVFHAAFALALAEGQAEDAALVFASAAAAQRCALGDVPRRSDVTPLCRGRGRRA